jgi:hypothetical protein
MAGEDAIAKSQFLVASKKALKIPIPQQLMADVLLITLRMTILISDRISLL